jgi:hypothetical protein
VWRRPITEMITSVGREEVQQKHFTISQNYPNPFNPTTTITYAIPEQAAVRIILYDALGREVRTLVNEEKTPGNYTISMDARTLATGIYYYQIRAGEFSETKKMVLVK